MLPTFIRTFLSQARSYLFYGAAVLMLGIAKTGYRSMPVLTASMLSERFYSYLFRYFSYHGNLRTDLERYVKTGMFRADWVRQEGEWVHQEQPKYRKRLRVGMLGTFGREANFPKEFFSNAPDNVELVVYDLHRSKNNLPYCGCPSLKDTPDVRYKKVSDLRHYREDGNGQRKLAKEINGDDIDVLVFNLGDFVLKLLDMLEVPVILPMNVSSLLVPHPKCDIQMFIQPPWPYEVRGERVFSLKNEEYLSFPTVESEGIIFARRATTAFEFVDWDRRKTQIYYSGNLKKLTSGLFGRTLKKLMADQPELELIYFGRSNPKLMDNVQSNFRKYGFRNRAVYGGTYSQNVNEEGEFIIDEDLNRAFTELSRSKLMLNTFPISGARSCIEAYALQVPVIHLTSSGEAWLKNQKYVPFRLPILYTDSGTAHTVEEYLAKANRVLDDASFAGTIINEQQEILDKLTDTKRFWNMILDIAARKRSKPLSTEHH